jgi:hypothetical protein
MTPIKIYNNLSPIPLPKGEKTGFGNAVFLLTKSQEDTIALLNNENIGYRQNYYKLYYIDAMYKERIGYKKLSLNRNSLSKKTFVNSTHPELIHQVSYESKATVFKKEQNVLIDLGTWMGLFFKYRNKASTNSLCESFINFLASKINDTSIYNYDKTVVIDVAYWFKDKILSFSRNSLNDPLTLLLFSLYKVPDLITPLMTADFFIIDSEEKKAIRIPGSQLIKTNYANIKSKLSQFDKLKSLDKTKEVEDTTTPDKQNSTVDAISKEKQKYIDNARTNIINSVKKNFVGEIDDITTDIEDEDISDNDKEEVFKTDNPMDSEIETSINEYLDDNPELLTQVDPAIAVNEVSDHVKKKVYIANFMPQRSEEAIKKIDTLQKNQDIIIGLPSFEDLDSKIIPESDFADCVKTKNPNILSSKFTNFDKSYNEKKLNGDIDNAIAVFQNATSKVFITSKSEEDTSDQLNLKKTLTYTLEDEKGKKMKLKFDIPIIIDDKYFYLNGAKKIIQHQLVLKPIVKTSPDTVQIVTLYQKVFITRKGDSDLAANTLVKMLSANPTAYKVKFGNAAVKNKDYKTSLEFDIIARSIYGFSIGDANFITEINALKEILTKLNIPYADQEKKGLLIGYNKTTKTPIVLLPKEQYIDKIKESMSEKDLSEYKKNAGIKKLMFAEAAILREHIPLILLLFFFEGFTSIMKKANIEYEFITDKKKINEYDKLEYGFIPLQDGTIVWKRYPLRNSMLMNGLVNLPTQLYSFAELDSKETYIFMLSQYHAFATQYQNIDQYKDFMIDNISKEILMDYHLPTDLSELMIYAAGLLTDNEYLPENNFNNMRIRSNELIAYYVYKEITDAYGKYRKSLNKKNPSSITIKQNCVLQDLKKDKLIEDNSVLNPVLELEKNRAVTYKGESGINLEQAMTLPRRGYDQSMLGVVGISTSPDANVGIVRQLTLEPAITSTRGYIDAHSLKTVDELNSANLLTPAESLTPLGVLHDDPTRSAMVYKQSKFMLLVDDSQPTLIGNKVESIIPYHLSDEFSIVAKDDGKIVDNQNGIVVVQYKSGEYKSIDTNRQVKKNAASGFYIESQLKCDKQVGDKVKKGEVIAYNPKAFTKDHGDLSASMNLGVLAKVAVVPTWDIYEDSAPITESLSQRMSTTMVSEISVALDKNCFVSEVAKIGDKLKTGDPLIKFNQYPDDPYTMKLLQDIREDLKEDLIADNISTVKSKYSGELIDIKIFTTVPVSELDPSVQKIVKAYHSKISKKDKVLDKYKNPGDYKYYKSGTLVSESEDVLDPDMSGKIRGVKVDEGVLIIFYIKYTDNMKKGDKLTQLTALKGIVSNVIPTELAPYSEYRPDEEISSIIAPLSITARKVPSIFLSMFGNKLLIELKRQLKDMYMD